jgi:hypothetical protein
VAGFTGAGPRDLAAGWMRKEDGTEMSTYPPGTRIASAPWLLSPVFGPYLLVVGYYDCAGRVVPVRLIDQVVTP